VIQANLDILQERCFLKERSMARSSPFITMGKENGCEMTLSSKRRGVSTALIEYF
jgi:hypothetical protein|tara:strand:- start:331 stop:495 length:165 start_codon:yes stop_codon:yes gene_type:complete